jgi:hypothetical protein
VSSVNALSDPEERRHSIALVVLALALFAWTHRHAFSLPGFAEDIGIVQELAAAAQAGTLRSNVMDRVLGPLWGPGSIMWRPFAYASLALDAWLYREQTGPWHLTNAIAHLLAAFATGLCARRMIGVLPGAFAFAIVLLNPWSAEVTLWLVGRFDGIATAATMLSLFFAIRSTRIDRWWAMSLVFAAIAYASKESAIIIVPIVFLYSAFATVDSSLTEGSEQARNSGRSRWIRAVRGAILGLRSSVALWGAHLLLLGAYLAIRYATLGTVRFNTYFRPVPETVSQWASNVFAHLTAFAQIAVASHTKVALVLAVSLLALAIGFLLKRASGGGAVAWSALVVGAAISSSTFGGVAQYLHANVAGNGDGSRFYYFAVVGFALLMATMVANLRTRIWMMVMAVCIVSLAILQDRVNRNWTLASHEMSRLVASIAQTAKEVPDGEYALVMAPAFIGAVPFILNAQSGAVRLARGRTMPLDPVDRLTLMVPHQIDEWFSNVQGEPVRFISKRTDVPARPTRYMCRDTRTDRVEPLGFWPANDLQTWRNEWRTRVRARCPSLEL